MLLGKRPRPPIRRTTSTTGLTVDLSDVEATNQPSDVHPMQATPLAPGDGQPPVNLNSGYDQQFHAMVSPREYRGGSSDFTETPHFLRSCGLCKRRLAPSRDIYMYRSIIEYILKNFERFKEVEVSDIFFLLLMMNW
ncbi:hypothetical protein SLEP1_g34794 [Rubroshorea leprosula]|uniref:FLZ-type domain-containing protein n=1 Tax=Rubroshorea leprosula TaxID=152421 RepID=A0AAV5KL41_9ROSI|nr:hypothetical protein SLEP1_g34794 [Rubroshorea leprosula]